jgi:hypothetical protein
MKAPGLAHHRAHGSARRQQLAQPRVVLGRQASPPRHAERADLGRLELHPLEQPEELRFLGVRAGKAGLDEVDPEPVEGLDHTDLLGGGEGHALSLHAVTQGRVVELHLFHVDAFLLGEDGGAGADARGLPRWPRAAKRPRRR